MKGKIDINVLIAIGTVIFTILGVVLPLCIHMDSKLERAVVAMNEEMKDFHGKLCAIEERRK